MSFFPWADERSTHRAGLDKVGLDWEEKGVGFVTPSFLLPWEVVTPGKLSEGGGSCQGVRARPKLSGGLCPTEVVR